MRVPDTYGMVVCMVDRVPDVAPHPILDSDVRILIGILAILEGFVLAGELPHWIGNTLIDRFVGLSLLEPAATPNDLRQALNDLNHRLRHVRGEYADPPDSLPLPVAQDQQGEQRGPVSWRAARTSIVEGHMTAGLPRHITASPPRVLVPAQPMASFGDKTVYLLTVELWRNEVCTRLAAVPTWRDDPDPGAVADPTDRHGIDELAGLQLQLSDDLGTHYQVTTGQTDGTDMEWRSDWHFRPGVPPGARVLRVRTIAEPSTSAELTLHEAS